MTSSEVRLYSGKKSRVCIIGQKTLLHSRSYLGHQESLIVIEGINCYRIQS